MESILKFIKNKYLLTLLRILSISSSYFLVNDNKDYFLTMK